MKGNPWLLCFQGILWREFLRFLHQRGRFFAALVGPLVWLFIFAAGFRSVLGVSIQPPYETYILYEVYITPGLCGMILLFSGMQTSLAMVYDREMGVMRLLLTAPLPRWWILACKLAGGAFLSLMQMFVFLLAAWGFGIDLDVKNVLFALPVFLLAAVMLGALGLVLSGEG